MANLDVVALDVDLVVDVVLSFTSVNTEVLSDSISITEGSTLQLILVYSIAVSDAVSITEDKVIETGKFASVTDSVSITESTSLTFDFINPVSNFDAISVGEVVQAEPYVAPSFLRDPPVSARPIRVYGKVMDEQLYVSKAQWFPVWQYDSVQLEFTGLSSGRVQVRGSNQSDCPSYGYDGFQLGDDRTVNGLWSFNQSDFPTLPVWLKVEKTTAGSDSVNCWFSGIIR